MDHDKVSAFVDEVWESEIVPQLIEYIRIPAKSPHYDPDWETAGHMDRAVELIEGWCKKQEIKGLTVEVVKLPGRTPVLFMEIPATDGKDDDCVLLYGHLDKQPEMEGWDDDLGPWKPVRKGDKLYGRGGADDGYAAYASLTAIRAVQKHGGKHARCVVLIEGCEESGSFDLPYYIEHLQARIGQPTLVVCLDSGCGNYEQLWCTTSLRGIVAGDLEVRVLDEGVHSGDASGIVPSSFRIARQLISRIEDEDTGRIIPTALQGELPEDRRKQAAVSARVLGESLHGRFPWAYKAHAIDTDLTELVLNRTWRPFLAVTGVDGMPPLDNAGNVMRTHTTLRLSLRVAPTCNVTKATAALKDLLEAQPPYGAAVEFRPEQEGPGWNAPAMAGWLEAAIEKASQTYFDKEAVYMGEGGSIPFMGMLGEKFPKAQFMITGVLGPQSNAHGPNEFLHIPMGKKLTACVAEVLCQHHDRG